MTDRIQHGIDCPKAVHIGGGYEHNSTYDGRYDVDGVDYCGRCHAHLDAASRLPQPVAAPQPENKRCWRCNGSGHRSSEETLGSPDSPCPACSKSEVAAPQAQDCKYGDKTCPCQDGDPCHYEGENPMRVAAPQPETEVNLATYPEPNDVCFCGHLRMNHFGSGCARSISTGECPCEGFVIDTRSVAAPQEEQPQTIWFHGTSTENAASIRSEGFRVDTWFSRNMQDAFKFGGPHIFFVKVQFDDAPLGWQVHSSNHIAAEAIVDEVFVSGGPTPHLIRAMRNVKPEPAAVPETPESKPKYIMVPNPYPSNFMTAEMKYPKPVEAAPPDDIGAAAAKINWSAIETLAKEDLCVDGNAADCCNVCCAILASREILKWKESNGK